MDSPTTRFLIKVYLEYLKNQTTTHKQWEARNSKNMLKGLLTTKNTEE